ncbi:MAG: hypothetical protein ACE5G0_01310 [Rhodothermales bacterium]
MAPEQNHESKKGFFSDVRLPVAKRYVYPRSRTVMFLAGGLGAVLIAVVFVFNVTMQRGALISNGPLSSDHAIFGTDCSNCHTPFGAVTDDKCAVCHEKYGDEIGVHTLASHYLYRSGDFTRLVPAPGEPACSGCHMEHGGREVSLTSIPDARCLSCHPFGSFTEHHPEFEFAAEEQADEAHLSFPHAFHVKEVKDQEALADVEKTCLYCHHPEPDGRTFQPLNFDRDCDACHLTSSTATPWLVTTDDAPAGAPAVHTLETIRAQQSPGTRWAEYTNPNEFQRRSSRVRKRPLYHEDPWILDNLRRLRGLLYPTRGLADLLKTSGDVDPQDAGVLYEEALATLRDYAEALRGRPERDVQQALEEVEQLLLIVEQRLRDPYSPLDETRFLISAAELDPALSPEQVAAYRTFIDQLTEPCQQCHQVENATLLRVQTDQKVLTRAEFNHRAHIIQRRCLECHTEIPIQRLVATETDADSTLDHAGIQNIPTITTCRTCHANDKASNTCITCHLFHPDTSQRANLLLYLDERNPDNNE